MKKFLTLLTSTCMLLCVGIGLTACGDKGCEHSYRESVTNPTCTERGYTTYTCDKCGDSYVDDYVDALNHSNRTWVEEESAIPGVMDGKLGHFHCSDCEKNFDEQGNEITDVVLHLFSEWIPAKNATCTSEGTVGFYFCSSCRKFFDVDKREISEENAIIPKVEHSFENWVEDTPATCETLGCSAHGFCSVCEKVYDANGNVVEDIQDLVIPYAHNLGEWVDEIPATCESEGTLGHYTCSACERNFDLDENELASLTIAISDKHALGEWVDEIPATCKTEGTLGHYNCSVCAKNFDLDKNELASLTIPVTDEHSYTDWIQEISSTCKVEGTRGHYACSICEKNFDENKNEMDDIIIPTEHKYKLGYCEFCSEPKINYDLNFTLSEDKTYYIVSGIGNCEDTYITIPSEYEGLPVKEIKPSAFKDCVDLVSVTIPNTVNTIGDNAFKSADSIVSLTISDGVESIGAQAFYGCHALTQINIPKSVSAIGSRAFDNCTGLTRLIVDSQNTSYATVNGVLYNADATILIQYPDGKTGVDFEVPEGVKSIGEYAFSSCANLKGVLTVSSSVERIEPYAFYLSYVSIVDFSDDSKLTYIGDYNFFFSQLIKVTIPEMVTTIGSNAFGERQKLFEIYNKSSLNLGNYSISARNVYTPTSGASKLTITTDDYVIYNDGTNKCLVGYVGDSTTLSLPDEVTVISKNAFRYSKVTNLTIPKNVRKIESQAFDNCEDLVEIKFYADLCEDADSNYSRFWDAGLNSGGVKLIIGANVKKIPAYLFNKFSNRYTHITEIIFEEGSVCESIGDHAFGGCEDLVCIVLPTSVTLIETDAFVWCESLETIYYMGSEVDWAKMEIESPESYGNNDFSEATRYYYSETEPTTQGNYWRFVNGVPTPWEN